MCALFFYKFCVVTTIILTIWSIRHGTVWYITYGRQGKLFLQSCFVLVSFKGVTYLSAKTTAEEQSTAKTADRSPTHPPTHPHP